VGRTLDEMPINTELQGSALDLRLLDIDRVEVLRGPQGTLYGEGSMGGTIRYITAAPDLQENSFRAEVQGGQVSGGGTSERINGVANLTMKKYLLGARVVAGYEKQAGWIDNDVTGAKDINDAEFRTIRGTLRAKPSDTFEASLLFLHQETDQDAQNFGFDQRTSARVPTFNNADYNLANFVVHYDVGWADLVNSLGWYKQNASTQNDLSPFYVPFLTAPPPFGFGLPAGFITDVGLVTDTDVHAYTEELRLASKPGGSVEWTVGIYGRDSDHLISSATSNRPGDLGFVILSTDLRYGSRSWAAFGDVSWHLTDALTADVGLRYFSDKREFDSTVASFGLPSLDTASDTFTSVNPRFNLRYQFSQASMVYFNAGKGFRSGGFNPTSSGGGTVTIPPSYDPETLWSYELGTKQQLWDHRLSFEGAVYYNDWKDVQSSAFAPGSSILVVENGGEVRGTGVDLSLVAQPAKGLTLSASYGWNNLEYKTATADKLPGDPVDYAIRKTWSAAIDYRHPLFGSADLFTRLDYQHAGEGQITLRNFGNQIVPIPERDLINLRLGLNFGRLQAAIFADNLTNEDAAILPGPFGVFAEDLEQRPRTVGVNLQAHF
jgi:outer membrane receptor protein involved in Fe transport